MTDRWLWRAMAADKVLVFGGNSAICANSKLTVQDFVKYDWVGPPWSALKKKGDEYVGIYLFSLFSDSIAYVLTWHL